MQENIVTELTPSTENEIAPESDDDFPMLGMDD